MLFSRVSIWDQRSSVRPSLEQGDPLETIYFLNLCICLLSLCPREIFIGLYELKLQGGRPRSDPSLPHHRFSTSLMLAEVKSPIGPCCGAVRVHSDLKLSVSQLIRAAFLPNLPVQSLFYVFPAVLYHPNDSRDLLLRIHRALAHSGEEYSTSSRSTT